jgi:hypothetical protein
MPTRSSHRLPLFLLAAFLCAPPIVRAATLALSAHPADPVDLEEVRDAIGADDDLIEGPATQIGNVFNFTVATSRLSPKERNHLVGPVTPFLPRAGAAPTEMSKAAYDVVNAIDAGMPVMVWMQEDGPDIHLIKICYSSGPVIDLAPKSDMPVSAAVAAQKKSAPAVEGGALDGMRAPHLKLPADIRRRLLDVREEISSLPRKPPPNPSALMNYEARIRNISGTLQTIAVDMKSQSRSITIGIPGAKEEKVIASIDKGGDLAAMAPVQVTSFRNLDPDVRGRSPINPTETLRRAYLDMNDNLAK